MKRLALLGLLLCPLQLPAQQPPRPPDTVFLEELTWDELRDLIRGGKTTIIIATAGTEQKGPHMVIGEHRFALEFTADRIARVLGNAIVAPIITHVPEGSWDPPSGHMRMAGTITLPNDRFMVLLENTARSLRASGFREIILLGDSGGNQTPMRNVAARLNEEWKGSGMRAHFIGDYYTKAQSDQRRYMIDSLNVVPGDIGSHAGMMDTSELLFINSTYIRSDKLARDGGFQGSGVSGDPTKASKDLGARLLQIKIDNAVAQIRANIAAPGGNTP
jgi:creatinine amidohydrolase/Fe(II)-dependent formamide hydrolase-like protein